MTGVQTCALPISPSYGLPGVVFDPSSKGAQAFVAFAEEMVARIQRV